MLNLVPPDLHLVRPDFGEARELLRFVESSRSSLWVLMTAALLLLAVGFLAAGVLPVGGLLIGAAVTASLCRLGPSWWPGRR